MKYLFSKLHVIGTVYPAEVRRDYYFFAKSLSKYQMFI